MRWGASKRPGQMLLMDDLSRHVLRVLGSFSDDHERGDEVVSPDRLEALLLAHGLLGFYGRKISPSPAGVQKGLAAQWAITLRLAGLQDLVMRVFAGAGIPCLILKGSPLSERLYDDALIRPVGDVDILVSPGEAQRAFEALRGEGFREIVSKPDHFHRSFQRPGHRETLELHHDLSDGRFSFPIPDIFARRGSVRLSGQEVAVMHPCDELLYLTAHHAHHYLLGRFMWLMDVAFFIERYGERIDWNAFVERARAWKLRHAVWASFAWAEHFFGSRWRSAERESVGRVIRLFCPPAVTRQWIKFFASRETPFSARVHTSAQAGRWLALALMDSPTSRVRQLWLRTGWARKMKSQT